MPSSRSVVDHLWDAVLTEVVEETGVALEELRYMIMLVSLCNRDPHPEVRQGKTQDLPTRVCCELVGLFFRTRVEKGLFYKNNLFKGWMQRARAPRLLAPGRKPPPVHVLFGDDYALWYAQHSTLCRRV